MISSSFLMLGKASRSVCSFRGSSPWAFRLSLGRNSKSYPVLVNFCSKPESKEEKKRKEEGVVSLVATLADDEISALKAKIEGYEKEYVNAAPGSEDKKELRAIITARRNNLTALYQQQGE